MLLLWCSSLAIPDLVNVYIRIINPSSFFFFNHTALHLYQIPYFNFNLLSSLQKVAKPTVALCQQKCKRSGTLESNYCSSNFGKAAKFVAF